MQAAGSHFTFTSSHSVLWSQEIRFDYSLLLISLCFSAQGTLTITTWLFRLSPKLLKLWMGRDCMGAFLKLNTERG